MSTSDHHYTNLHPRPNRRYRSRNLLLAGFTLLATLAFLSLLYIQGCLVTPLFLHQNAGGNSYPSELSLEDSQSQNAFSKHDLEELAQSALRAATPTLLSTIQLDNNDGRLIIIGDVHGCNEELEELLEKVRDTSSERDHIIFVGDLVAKGPYSKRVVEKARTLGAFCVRGNHDQRVLLSQYIQTHVPASRHRHLPYKLLNRHLPKGLSIKSTHINLAKNLSGDDLTYLIACPAMLKLPEPYATLVVHGGIDPFKSLIDQDPNVVMTVRNILKDGSASASRQHGMAWAKLWNRYRKHHSNLAETAAENLQITIPTKIAPDYQDVKYIVYGHDAGRGLKIRKYAYGLDSGCVYGGNLTALVLPDWELISVPCKVYSDH
ncbi:hypothetical protein IWQ61_006713 [Dispira simplex]|nr:hypothetical protein IWQ61_006713 [Dispira simplex]